MTAPPFAPGTGVRLKRDARDLCTKRELYVGPLSQPFQFEIETFVSAEESEDGKPFYWGIRSDGTSVCVEADAVEQIRTPEEQRARKLPTAHDVAKAVAAALVHEDGYVETSSTEAGVVEAYGRTAEDVPFGVRIEVRSVWRTDD